MKENVDTAEPDLSIKLPKQARSREAWRRILEAGAGVLEVEGYEGFTIAKICDRADVPPRAIYDRAASKEGLFLAVFEFGIERVMVDHGRFDDLPLDEADPAEVIRSCVETMAWIFDRHGPFLRSIVSISGRHREVLARGERHVADLRQRFARPIEAALERSGVSDVERSTHLAFGVLFSALVTRLHYGPDLATPGVGDAEFVSYLVRSTQAAVLRSPSS